MFATTIKQPDRQTGNEHATKPSLPHRILFYELPKGHLFRPLLLTFVTIATLFLFVVVSDAWSEPTYCPVTPAQIRSLEAALMQYKTLNRHYPTQAQGLESLVTRSTIAPLPQRWSQMVKLEALIDPWDRKIQFRNPGIRNRTGFDVFSLGPDGIESTDDDIGNW